MIIDDESKLLDIIKKDKKIYKIKVNCATCIKLDEIEKTLNFWNNTINTDFYWQYDYKDDYGHYLTKEDFEELLKIATDEDKQKINDSIKTQDCAHFKFFSKDVQKFLESHSFDYNDLEFMDGMGYHTSGIFLIQYSEKADELEQKTWFKFFNIVNTNKFLIFVHPMYNEPVEIEILDSNDVTDTLKDFFYKVDQSNKFDIQTIGTIDDFFKPEFSDEEDYISILIPHTTKRIITIKKTTKEFSNYKFIVEIGTDNSDDFIIRTTFDTKEKFEQLLKSTIEALKGFEVFYKYAEDLENILE